MVINVIKLFFEIYRHSFWGVILEEFSSAQFKCLKIIKKSIYRDLIGSSYTFIAKNILQVSEIISKYLKVFSNPLI